MNDMGNASEKVESRGLNKLKVYKGGILSREAKCIVYKDVNQGGMLSGHT